MNAYDNLNDQEHEDLRRRFYEMLHRQMSREQNPAPTAAKRVEEVDDTKPTKERMLKAGDDMEREAVRVKERLPSGDEREADALVYRLEDSPIDRLAFGKKPRLTGAQYQAGIRFYADAYKAGLMPSGVVDPSKTRVDGGQYKDISDFRIAAQTRFEHALRAITHPQSHILDAVVLQEVALADYAERFKRHRERRIRQGVALERLCEALDALDKHYNPPRRDRGIGSSHAPDYRPSIPPLDDPS